MPNSKLRGKQATYMTPVDYPPVRGAGWPSGLISCAVAAATAAVAARLGLIA